MLEEIAEITEKDVLPLMGFTYAGNMDVEGQELFINLGPLICQPNLEFEAQHSIQNQLAYLEDRINSTDEVLVNQGEDLATLKVFIIHWIGQRLNTNDQVNTKSFFSRNFLDFLIKIKWLFWSF